MKFVVCLWLLVAINFAAATEQSTSVTINNINVVNAETGKVEHQQTVIVENGVISKVYKTNDKSKNNVGRVIDGSGKYLIPGLIDSHVHISSTLGMSLDQEAEYPKLVKQFQQQLPKSYLYFGFTSLVDLNSFPGRLTEFRQQPIHPEVYDCGSALMLENGYPLVFMPKKKRLQVAPNIIFNPDSNKHVAGVLAKTHSIAEGIKRVKAGGAICVKSFHEDGFAKPIWPVPSSKMLQEMATEAHKYELRLLLHANSINAYKAVLDSGVDIIVHGMWNWDEYRGQAGLPNDIKAVLNEIILKDIGVMPTLRVLGGSNDMFNTEFLQQPEIAKVLPKAFLEWLKSPKANWFKASLVKRLKMSETVIADKQRNIITEGNRAFKYLYQRDAKILFGTDTPASPSYGNVPGFNGYLEMKALANAGMALKDLLASATIRNAEAFGLENKLGSIVVGKTANLLILNDNPLKTIEAYNNIDQVVLQGEVYNREDFAVN